MRPTIDSFFLFLLATALCARGTAQTSYSLTEIVPPPGEFLHGLDLNDAGVVVGRISQGGLEARPFAWAHGTLVELPMPAGATTVYASSVDNAGRIYGYIDIVAGTRLQLPVLWLGAQPFELPTLFFGASQVLRTSPSGEFVATNTRPYDHPTLGWKNRFGWIDEPDFTDRSGDNPMPFVFDLRQPRVHVAGSFSGSPRASVADVSDSGYAAGSVSLGGYNHFKAVRWDSAQGMVLIGTGGRRASQANAVNTHGVVVGVVHNSGAGDVNTDIRLRPFIWRAGALQELALPPGFAHGQAKDINDHGVVIGNLGASVANRFQTDGAWVYSNGSLRHLDTMIPPSSGWHLTDAIAINDAGQILVADRMEPSFSNARYALLTPR